MKTSRIAFASALALALSAGSFAIAAPKNSAANPDPSAMDRAGAAVGNKVDQAVGGVTPITADEMATAVPAASIMDPAKSLATAQIKNPAGEPIGTVSSVDVTAKGKAKAVHADVGGFLGMGSHVVALDAGKLKYLKSRNLLVTEMTKDEIKALPKQAEAN